MNLSFVHKGIVAAVAALLSVSASASDLEFYVGAGASYVSEDFDIPSNSGLDEDAGFKLIGGVKVLDWLSLEANYSDFGTASGDLNVVCPAVVGFPCPSGIDVDANAFSVSPLLTWSLPMVDLYARVGVARWKVKSTTQFTSGPDASDKERGTDAVYGAGAALKLGSWALRAEYEYFDLDHDAIEAATLGFTYSF